jgi:aminopeptidase
VTDPRVERLARLVVEYSLGLGEGDAFRIDAHESAEPLVLAFYRAALAAGAFPFANVEVDGLAEQLLAVGSADQIAYVSPIERHEIETIDALVTIWSEGNTRSLTRVDPARQSSYLAAQRELSDRRWERISKGELAWCGTLHPTPARAQEAEMSLEDYEAFVFSACHADQEDPAAHWRASSAELVARARSLELVRELRVLGPDTDLRVGVAGRTWMPADGRRNMPDGEVFTSPVETETEGEIRFTLPAVFYGREVEDIRLRFEGGRVVAAEARRGGDYLQALLDTDEGARVLGEYAFGLNYEIDRWTRNILFDEKIGGTVHLALGSSFDECGGKNTSALHWDIICDLREEGEIYADGELIWRAGQFLAAPKPVAERV